MILNSLTIERAGNLSLTFKDPIYIGNTTFKMIFTEDNFYIEKGKIINAVLYLYNWANSYNPECKNNLAIKVITIGNIFSILKCPDKSYSLQLLCKKIPDQWEEFKTCFEKINNMRNFQ